MVFFKIFEAGEEELFFHGEDFFGFEDLLSRFVSLFSEEEEDKGEDEDDEEEDEEYIHDVEWCFLWEVEEEAEVSTCFECLKLCELLFIEGDGEVCGIVFEGFFEVF